MGQASMDGDCGDRKLGSVRRTECCREYKRLKLQGEFLERNLSSVIKGLRIDADLIRQLDEDRAKACGPRETELAEIGASVIAAFAELRSVRSILRTSDRSAIENLDVREFGNRLTKLAKKIEDFKGRSELAVLAREEESLVGDLREFERVVLLGEAKAGQPISKIPDRKCPGRSEVSDQFTELVARTGHTEGWSAADHSLFLRTRSRFESVPRAAIEMRKKRPHLTNEDVVNHESWYKLYTELREKRKREIAAWRSKIGAVDRIVERADQPKTEIDNRGVSGERKKAMIEEWRAEKSRKSAMDEEQKIRLEKARADEDKRRRSLRRREARVRLENRGSSGYAEISTSQNRASEERRSNRYSVRLLKSFREQDERFVRRRQSRSKAPEKFADRMEPATMRERERSTLLKPTKVWEERCRRYPIPDKPEDLFARVNYVKDIQRLSSAKGT